MHHRSSSPSFSAFSLVELAIVLVVLGLLVGGVLSGKSLIRAAELRAYTTQYKNYSAAVYTFRDKYFALPGDMPNATQFWGLQVAGVGCAVAASSDTKTCDGNGNGQIFISAYSSETRRLWQHLANAGMIEGSYDGANARPKSKLGGSGLVEITYRIKAAPNLRQAEGEYGHVLYDQFNRLLPEEAWNLDTKLDDGKPMTGKVVIYEYTSDFPAGTCSEAASSADYAANYRLSSSVADCFLFIRNQFGAS